MTLPTTTACTTADRAATERPAGSLVSAPTRLARLARLRTLPTRFARDEHGAATAEYAIATMAAVAFAGLLVAIMQSDAVRTMLEDLVRRALTFAG